MKKLLVLFMFLFLHSNFVLAENDYVDVYIEKIESYFTENGGSERLSFLSVIGEKKEDTAYTPFVRNILSKIYDRTMVRFDNCSDPSDYESYERFNNFSTIVSEYDILFESNGDRTKEEILSEMCYSKNSQLLVFNVPYMKSDKKRVSSKGEVYDYHNGANIFIYEIAYKRLEKADRNGDHFQIWGPPKGKIVDARRLKPVVFHRWNDSRGAYEDISFQYVIRGFGPRIEDTIKLTSGYGDLGCISEITYDYNIVQNNVGVHKICGGCVANESNDAIEDSYSCEYDFDITDMYLDIEGDNFWKEVGTDIYDSKVDYSK